MPEKRSVARLLKRILARFDLVVIRGATADAVIGTMSIDVALNIHQLLGVLAHARTPWLFIVRNTGDELISWEQDQ